MGEARAKDQGLPHRQSESEDEEDKESKCAVVYLWDVSHVGVTNVGDV